MNIKIMIIGLLICGNFVVLKAQNTCGYSKEDLEKFGPWICPGYVPSPGFPGNPNPYQLREVVVYPSKPTDQTPIIPGYPVVAPPPGAGTNTPVQKVPCGGNPVRNPSIAPTGRSKYKGGTYGYTRQNESGNKKFHDGIDIYAQPGSYVHAMQQGVVSRMNNSFQPGQYRRTSYGNFVEIRSIINGQTIYLKYNHLDGVNSNLSVGMEIPKGYAIGVSGTTGNAAAPGVIPHVHIQARDNDGRKDPAEYMETKFSISDGKPINPCQD